VVPLTSLDRTYRKSTEQMHQQIDSAVTGFFAAGPINGTANKGVNLDGLTRLFHAARLPFLFMVLPIDTSTAISLAGTIHSENWIDVI